MAANNTKKASNSNSAAKKAAPKASAKNTIDLGLASIAKSTTNATKQTATTVNESLEKGSQAIKGAFANASTNAKQIQDKVSSFSKEISQNLTQTANKAAKNANVSLELARHNAECIARSCNHAAQSAKSTASQLFDFANETFTDNVEAARQALECRNVGEWFQLQNATLKQNIEAMFGQVVRLSEAAVQSATQILEPINESVAKSSKKISELVN